MEEHDLDLLLSVSLEELEFIVVSKYAQKKGIAVTASDVRVERGISKAERDAIISEIRKRVSNLLHSTSNGSREFFCVRLAYCQNKNSDLIGLVTAVADSYYMSAFEDWCPRVSIAAYIVRSKFLDPLCNCAPD